MPSDWTRRSVYRARVIRRRRRLLAVLVVLTLVAIGAVVAHGQGGGGRVAYDRAAAVAYADRWALGADPAYWHSPHDDCANFVSQCVAAGGLPRFEGPAGSWRDNGRSLPSIGWVNCTAQQRVWGVGSGSGSPYIVSTTTRLPRGWAAGDVV
jgi:Putative amidase domain